MTAPDKALAAAIDAQIDARRTNALTDDDSTNDWTNRDVARRLTAVGHPIAHSQVHRLRKGLRRITVGEWLAVALVLSVPPLALLRDKSALTIGEDHDPGEVHDWITGRRPLDSVADKGHFHGFPMRVSEETASHFARTLRHLADQYDDTERGLARVEITNSVILSAVTAQRANLPTGTAEAEARKKLLAMARDEHDQVPTVTTRDSRVES